MSASSLASVQSHACFRVLGVRVAAVQIADVISQMDRWIADRSCCHYIAVTGMHGITEAQHHSDFKDILNSADLVVADGMPLVWLGRLRGFALPRRVYGPELMLDFCAHSATRGRKHFLYGGNPGVADRLASVLRGRFPGLNVVGTCSPPFRALTRSEDDEAVREINQSEADVVWVSLSEIKQDRWMFEHRDRLKSPVLVGIGAAFDFHAGLKKQAPPWMRENGFEWLYRLQQEPRRLWRRYLVYGSEFMYRLALDEVRSRTHK